VFVTGKPFKCSVLEQEKSVMTQGQNLQHFIFFITCEWGQ
jgi:hypothetical protein